MAEGEDRTEAATPARLSRARSEGQAPVSHELASFANLAGAILLIVGYGPALAAHTAARLAGFLANAGAADGTGFVAGAIQAAASIALHAVLPVALLVLLLGAGVVLAQTGLTLRLTAFMPDINRLNPIAGIGKLFSKNHGVDAMKSIMKIGVMSIVLWFALSSQLHWLPDCLRTGSAAASEHLQIGVVAILAPLIVIQAFIAILDVAWSRVSFATTMKMSREDVKQETKDADGNPQIKARIRALRNARAKQNLKKAMAKATVVVTNPTHYAVALAYERNSAAAPKVVAKGVNETAARIRELAAESRIPLYPNPPLARELHKLEIDTEIPLEHYKAVADIIAYIWRLEAQTARAKMI